MSGRGRGIGLVAALVLLTAGPAAAGTAALTAADVESIARAAARSIDLPFTIAVVDRAGNPLGVFDKPGAPNRVRGNFGERVDTHEQAVALARTAAFFSNDQAPLTSRTVRFISGIHFPPGIQNKPNAALYGIENTNRGCDFNATFNADKLVPRARSLDGIINALTCDSSDQSGCGLGIATGKPDRFDTRGSVVNPGGVPIFRPTLVGGIGVAGNISPGAAEFAAFAAVGIPRGFIYLDGLRLPGVNQQKRPPGLGPGTDAGLAAFFGPIGSPMADGVPDGYLIGPSAGSRLSRAEVVQIVRQARDMANITRAAIRLPNGSPTRMMISVADLNGDLLAVFRMPDATIFSIDVSVAKARNVVYFSDLWQGSSLVPGDLSRLPIGTAVTNRTISFGAQPLYPPGINGSKPGPFFDLYNRDIDNICSQGFQPANANQNGIVFFPGSTALFRNGVPVGGLGVSGDGVEQDDLVTAAGATGFAPPEDIRADRVFIRDVRLPYLKFNRNPLAR